MANNLTGDFDVVAEFAVLAVDRLLAAMHQTGRFLHSISARVDDNPHPTRPGWPTFVGAVDSFGDAIANQRQVGTPNPFPGPSAASDEKFGTVTFSRRKSRRCPLARVDGHRRNPKVSR
jgi:hypothetical protein